MTDKKKSEQPIQTGGGDYVGGNQTKVTIGNVSGGMVVVGNVLLNIAALGVQLYMCCFSRRMLKKAVLWGSKVGGTGLEPATSSVLERRTRVLLFLCRTCAVRSSTYAQM